MAAQVGAPVSPLIPYAGYVIVAPGFSPEDFARAVARALAEGLTIERGADGLTVRNARSGGAYRVTPRTCSCPAGQHGRACKHRALVALVATITGHGVRAP